MPAQVRVDVKVEDAKALSQLSNLEAQIEKLNKQGVKIKIDLGKSGSGGQSGLTTVAKEAKEVATAVQNAGNIISRSAKSVNGELKQTTTVFEESVGRQKKVIRDLGEEEDRLTEITSTNYAKIRKEQEKAAQAAVKETQRQIKEKQKLEKELEKAGDKAAKQFDREEAARNRASANRMKVAAQNAAAAQKEALAEEEAANRKVAAWAKAAKVAVAAVTVKATKEALSNMKEVDSELANIRKVTGASAEVISQLGEASYDVASKYGVAAKDYLSAATDFAKAGKQNYASLAELAIKTQLAGDVSAETASKFLLAADAAYKMNGDIEQLSLVLDKANELDNNYATSIEKIAEGFPIVANTAHMANMSIEELMASLGTITAVTQQTGRKAATALRALILNITGEIGATVEEEGEEMFTVTEESVKSMSDALRKYGSDAVKTAIDLGKVVDPMEAIRSIAQAWKNGDLDEQSLFSILSNVGGKLRTEQLVALVQNFDMVEQQIASMSDAAGSADKEIANLLETWDKKLNQLSNTWTKFVSHVLNVKAIKDGIDFLRSAIDLLDRFVQTPVGDAALRVGALTIGFNKLWKVISTIQKTSFGKALATGLSDAVQVIQGGGGLVDALELAGKQLDNIDLKTLKLKTGLEIIAAEIMAVVAISNKRAEINSDRFKHMYGVATEDITGFAGKASSMITSAASGSYRDTAESLSALLAQYQGIYDQLKKDVTPENSKLFEEEMGFKAEDFISAFENAKNAIGLFEDAAEEAENATTSLGDAAEKTAKSYDNATDALKHFAEATETVKSANANAYRSDYQTFLTDWTAGKTDTNAVRAAIDIFIPAEVQKQMGYDMQALGELLAGDLYKGIFNGDLEDPAADFANYLYDHMTDELSQVVKVTEAADGTLNFEYASAQKLANALKLPLGVVKSLIEALDEYGVEVEMGWEDTENLAKNLGLVGESAEKSSKSIEQVVRGLAGMEQYQDRLELRKAFNALSDAGYIDVSNLDASQINQAIQDALDKIDAEKEVTLTVDEEGNAEGLANTIEKIPDKKTINVLARVYGASDVWGLVNAINSANSKTVTVTANTSGSNVTVNPVTTVNHSRANGTKNDPGGPTLVNELGPELISDNGRAYIANGGKPAIVNLGQGAIVLTAEETRQATGGIKAAASGIPRAGGSSGLSGGYNAYVNTSGEDKSEEEIVREEAKALEELAEYYHNMKQHSDEAAAYQEAINKLERIRAWYRANGLTETDTRMASVANEIFDLEQKMQEAGSHAIDDLEDELDLLDKQITLAENQNDAQRALELEKQAQEKIAELIRAYQAAGYSDTSEEILRLVNNGYSYASSSDSRLGDMRKELIAAIKAMRETQEDANTLAEKQLAVDEARTALENAQNQRTVRVFNPVTGQWEWVANAKDIADAEKNLKSAEEALAKEQQSQELASLENALNNGSSLKDITIGPALSALISNASIEETNALASALGVLTGGIQTTADTSSRSVFDSIDSHDNTINYTFNGVQIGQAMAETTTLAQLAQMISPLALTNNMPA